MRLIPNPLKGDQRCAVTNRGSDPRGFIHTHNVLSGWDPEVLVSVAAAEEMGRMIGMVSKEEIGAYLDQLKRMGQEIHDLNERLEAITEVREGLERLEVAV